MQQFNIHPATQQIQEAGGIPAEQQFSGPMRAAEHMGGDRGSEGSSGSGGSTGSGGSIQEAMRAAERARLRQGIMHVRIRHFYCTLEEMFDPSLRGQAFVVGTGTGRPNEPGRVIDASPAAVRLGVSPGMPLRRAHRLAPRTRFMPASYDRYQPILQKLKERYRAYSRIIESIPIADAFIDLRGCEIPFESPVVLAERLCAEVAEMGLTALIGIANGKAIAELAALMSRKDGRQGVLYIPPGREASFVQTLPLSLLLQLRAAGTGLVSALPDLAEAHEANGFGGMGNTRPPEVEGRSEQVDSVAVAELVAHLRDFGVVSFAQVAGLTEEGLIRRLGRLGGWVFQVANGEDSSLVVPDAPPLSQNARVRFHHAADADETCAAIRKLANYLSDRLIEQRLKGQTVALILWPHRLVRRETRKLVMGEEGEEMAVTTAEETIGGQILLTRHADEADIIAHHSLMLFAHYHRPTNRYLQVQLRIGDIIATTPTYYPPPARTRGRATRKLG
jgi:nucleotidyltransferase/DNA polymerase involved in DNA repair